jgi:outer membrane protein TolC
MRVAIALLFLVLAGCAGSWRDDVDRLSALYVRFEPPDGEADPDLSGELDLPTLIRLARARNPELREAAARTRASLEEAHHAGLWDDPLLRIQTEATPLRQPTAFNQAMDNLVGLQQNIPFPGNPGLRSEAALREAESLHEHWRLRERDVVARVRKAHAEYFSVTKELETYLEHGRLLEEFEKISDSRFRNGAVSQQDVLKPQVEIVMLQNEILSVRQRIESAQAGLNRLLGRAARAPLGKPQDLVPSTEARPQAVESHPEIRSALFRVKAAQAHLHLARREATLPDFSIGVDYWQIPGESDGWGGMVAINLPWFTGKRRAETRRFEELLRAEEAALDAARARALFEARDAAGRAETARKSLLLFTGELLPRTAQSVEVSRANYEQGRASFLDLLDGERSRREMTLRYYQAIARYETALADLDQAAGADVEEKP